MYLLDIEALDIGPDVRAIALELLEDDEQREPVRGAEAAAVWARVLPAVAGDQPWLLDAPGRQDRARDVGWPPQGPANARSSHVPSQPGMKSRCNCMNSFAIASASSLSRSSKIA